MLVDVTDESDDEIPCLIPAEENKIPSTTDDDKPDIPVTIITGNDNDQWNNYFQTLRSSWWMVAAT